MAAGPFLTNPEDVEADEWLEMPADLRLDDDMFVARIRGHSMEPKIPDGSLCVFRRNVVGSRNDRLVLVRNSELADDNQYTVKRYRSEKRVTEDGFVQTRIRLESLNPAFPSWDLDRNTKSIRSSLSSCGFWSRLALFRLPFLLFCRRIRRPTQKPACVRRRPRDRAARAPCRRCEHRGCVCR